MRVSPVAVLRGIGTSYVNIFRNTPLTLLMVLSVLGLSLHPRAAAQRGLCAERLLVGRGDALALPRRVRL
jgi:ABC-type amino acid transport system permease subunit